ncbi:alginate O-acetyltransferase AlgX-related protein [Duganella hordei]|uniref:alginate O-acetyltransferase AlgX-related protein n=1 Tax=Duganella hordei TaxID=2865934 RepID=UPI0030EA3EBA
MSLSRISRAAFVLLIFAISLVPAIVTFGAVPDQYIPVYPELIEMRPLAQLPTHWEGRWFNFDKNYRNFEKGFSDHLGLRNLMVRTKNEIDFRLFDSSRRVYFGKKGELYGRSISDIELPAVEGFLANPVAAEAVYQGMTKLSARLKAQGVTMVLMTPVSKQYFTQDRIPFFLPRVEQPSNFMKLYRRLEGTPDFNFVDVYGILTASQGKFPIFYRQDFHWTDLTAMQVAAEATNRIARMENLPPAWRHEMTHHDEPFVGSEARFAARLDADEVVLEPKLTKTWQDVHRITEMDAGKTGIEFVTDKVTGRGLLPPTCMYGNSFSDGMLRAGLTDHFEQFTKLNRALPPQDAPALIRGRCKYLIVQVLDNSAGIWLSLTQ